MVLQLYWRHKSVDSRFMTEIPENKIFEKELAPKLEALYSQVPNWESILRSVKEGENDFIADLKTQGLDKLGIDTSEVHSYSDIEVQAFIVGIPSKDNPYEVATRAYLVFGAHWIDDFFDNPKLGVPFEEIFKDRYDIKKVLTNLGQIGQVGFLLAGKVPHPEGVYKGLGRMLYGGLVQRSNFREQRVLLTREYQDLGIRLVDGRVAEEIKSIQAEAYLMTNKVVLEFMNASESSLDFTVAELWNLIYAPALYYHDIGEEEQSGESSFEGDEKPRDEEMVKMIRIGAKYLSQFSDDKLDLRIQQLQFLLSAFRKNLPDAIISEYQTIIKQYGR